MGYVGQQVVIVPVTALTATFAKAMEKRPPIPGVKKPAAKNAAARTDVDRVMRRLEALGFSAPSAFVAAGMSRQTGWRMQDYDVTVSTLRRLEEWVVSEEQRQKKAPAATKSQLDDGIREWVALGEELQKLDPSRFAASMDAVRDFVEAKKLEQRAFTKMFRATPDHDR